MHIVTQSAFVSYSSVPARDLLPPPPARLMLPAPKIAGLLPAPKPEIIFQKKLSHEEVLARIAAFRTKEQMNQAIRDIIQEGKAQIARQRAILRQRIEEAGRIEA